MIIYCTKKLQDALKIKPEGQESPNLLFSWHANIISVARRKVIVLTNDISGFAFFLYGIKAKELANFSELIIVSIRQILKSYGITPEIIERYTKSKITYAKAQSKKSLAANNNMTKLFKFFDPDIFEDDLLQIRLSKYVNTHRNSSVKEFPRLDDFFWQNLQEHYQMKVRSNSYVQIKSRLLLGGLEVKREFIVPLRYTFYDLHKVLQVLYGWESYHLHEFTTAKGRRLLCRIVPEIILEDTGDMLDDGYNSKPISDLDATLQDFLIKYQKWLYTYDFGDSWEHELIIGKVADDLIDGKNIHNAKCISGVGMAPPEDSGRTWEYDNFDEILKNPEHDEYKYCKYVDDRLKQEFDMERINVKLSFIE